MERSLPKFSQKQLHVFLIQSSILYQVPANEAAFYFYTNPYVF